MNRPLLARLAPVAVALAILTTLAFADQDPRASKYDDGRPGHFGILLSVTSATDTTIVFPFPASLVVLQSFTANAGFNCRVYGANADTIRARGGSGTANPYVGAYTVGDTLLPIPAVTGAYSKQVFDGDGAAVYGGVYIDGTTTMTLWVSAVRGKR